MKKINKIVVCTTAILSLGMTTPVIASANTYNRTIYNHSDELIKFLSETEPSRIINDNLKVIAVNYLGTDENGNELYDNSLTPIEIDVLLGFDENGNSVCGLANEELVRFDENGIPEIVSTEELGTTEEGNFIYKTMNVVTGEDMLVKADWSHSYNIISKCGDANLDGYIDIRDAAALKQHIIQLKSLPDYAFTADINSDGIVNIKDLGMLNKYIIKVIDKF